jgi:hypothetical protein
MPWSAMCSADVPVQRESVPPVSKSVKLFTSCSSIEIRYSLGQFDGTIHGPNEKECCGDAHADTEPLRRVRSLLAFQKRREDREFTLKCPPTLEKWTVLLARCR